MKQVINYVITVVCMLIVIMAPVVMTIYGISAVRPTTPDLVLYVMVYTLVGVYVSIVPLIILGERPDGTVSTVVRVVGRVPRYAYRAVMNMCRRVICSNVIMAPAAFIYVVATNPVAIARRINKRIVRLLAYIFDKFITYVAIGVVLFAAACIQAKHNVDATHTKYVAEMRAEAEAETSVPQNTGYVFMTAADREFALCAKLLEECKDANLLDTRAVELARDYMRNGDVERCKELISEAELEDNFNDTVGAGDTYRDYVEHVKNNVNANH